MNVAVCYPYILPKAEQLRPEFTRFQRTLAEFPAGYPHEKIIELSEAQWAFWAVLQDLKTFGDYFFTVEYCGIGWDIGAHQHAALSLPSSMDFAVFCSSQTYFHRAGWLVPLLDARRSNGPGLYGAMGSLENNPHVRTCFFGVDLALFRSYPHVINSREKTLEFESGAQNFTLWVDAQGASVRVVYWDQVVKLQDCRAPNNVFRKGDQSNCLAWDRHTEIYANADPETKAGLESSANGAK
jgi:hypothetical protein